MKWWQVALDGLGWWSPPKPEPQPVPGVSAYIDSHLDVDQRPVAEAPRTVNLDRVVHLPKPIPVSTVAEGLKIPKVPAPDRFDACLSIVLRHEGGYVNDPKDPGGATNMGITLATLAAFRGKAVTAKDVQGLTRAEAALIYRARYWDPMQCPDLPPGVDLMVFDFGVNSGPGRSTRMLQSAVGAAQDGQIGPKTLAAVRSTPAAALVTTLAARRMAYLRGLPGWERYGKGWSRRVEETKAAALAVV